jgi:hypothetical protein
MLAIATLTVAPLPDGVTVRADEPSTVDFRHSPPEWQTSICLPDDPHKTLVDRCGELLYHYGQGGREFATRVGAEVVPDAAWQRQELLSARAPVVRTFRTAPGLEILEEAFAITDLRAGASPPDRLTRTDGGGVNRDWAKPPASLDPSLRHIALHNGGSLRFEFAVPAGGSGRVALALCEGWWKEAGKRVQVLRVEGAEPRTVDTVADLGPNQAAAFWFDAKDTNGDAQIAMPHNWASAEFVRLVVHLLALDRGDELHLLEGFPSAWAGPGMVTRLNGVATPFGPLHLAVEAAPDGRTVAVTVKPLAANCGAVIVHLPDGTTRRLEGHQGGDPHLRRRARAAVSRRTTNCGSTRPFESLRSDEGSRGSWSALLSRAAAVLLAACLVAVGGCATRPGRQRSVVERMPGLVGFWTFGEKAGNPRVSAGTPGGPSVAGSRWTDPPRCGRAVLGLLRGVERPAVLPDSVCRDRGLEHRRPGRPGEPVRGGADREPPPEPYHRRDVERGAGAERRHRHPPVRAADEHAHLRRSAAAHAPHFERGRRHAPADGSAFPWCADYAATRREVPEEEWCTLGFTYDGKHIRAYLNGVLDARELDPEQDRRTDRYFTQEGPGGRDRGMNPYYHGRGIFRYDPARHAPSKPGGGSDFTVGARYAVGSMLGEATIGRFGGLAVFNRALADHELQALHAAARVDALNVPFPCLGQVDLSVTGVTFIEPVYAGLRTGMGCAIPPKFWSKAGNGVTFRQVPLDDSPVLIAERSTLPVVPQIAAPSPKSPP